LIQYGEVVKGLGGK